jgi:hypothetical protein
MVGFNFNYTGDWLTVTALRDVEANVRNLRRYVIQFHKSENSIEEFENLPEIIIRALEGYDSDILAVKQLLPPKPLEKRTEKVRWALKRREIQELMERITRRNSNLNTALEIMEWYVVAFSFIIVY